VTGRPLLDPVALDEALAPFGHSRTLPPEAYRNTKVLAWEQARLFEGSWVCVGRADCVARVGDQRATVVGRGGVLVARGADGTLGAFANFCRHRGHELLACGEQTRSNVIQCPYHAWSYELDGALRAAPRFDGVPNFDPARLGLIALRVHEWGGFVFVNVSGHAAAFADHVGDLDEILAPYELDRLVPAATHHYELSANWKLVHENYHECYHCPRIHPELCQVTRPTSGHNAHDQRGDWFGGSLQLRDHAATMSFDGAAVGPPFAGLDARTRREVMYVSLLPDLLISAHPDYVMTHRLVPQTTARTVVECQWLFPPEVVAAGGFDPSGAVGLWDVTNRQDWAAVESVQRGIESPLYQPGLLAPQEDAVHEFIVRLASAYRHATI
jgi:Rieske 2Fe-2S family protein